MPERLKPTPVASSKSARSLADFYLRNGESPHVDALERALTDEWTPTDEVLTRAGKSGNWGRNALEYLVLQERAERGTEKVDEYKIFGRICDWRYVWRKPPNPYADEPQLLPDEDTAQP